MLRVNECEFQLKSSSCISYLLFLETPVCPEIPTKHTQLDKHALEKKNPTLSPLRRHSHLSLRVYRTLTR